MFPKLVLFSSWSMEVLKTKNPNLTIRIFYNLNEIYN
jgi:hypothetical protein